MHMKQPGVSHECDSRTLEGCVSELVKLSDPSRRGLLTLISSYEDASRVSARWFENIWMLVAPLGIVLEAESEHVTFKSVFTLSLNNTSVAAGISLYSFVVERHISRATSKQPSNVSDRASSRRPRHCSKELWKSTKLSWGRSTQTQSTLETIWKLCNKRFVHSSWVVV